MTTPIPLLVGSGNIRHLKLPFTFADSTALLAGMTGLADVDGVYVEHDGDLILDAWFEIITGFDGTTPKGDVGTFSSYQYGLFGNIGYQPPLDTADTTIGDGLFVSGNNTVSSLVQAQSYNGGYRIVPARLDGTQPLKVCASQDGTTSGTELDSTDGSAIAHVLLLPAPA